MKVYIVMMENNHIDSVWSSFEAAKEYLNKSSYCYADNDRTPGRNTLRIIEWNVRDKYESPLCIEVWQGTKEIKGIGVDSVKVRAAAYECAAVLDRYNPNDKELELILEKIPDTWKTPEYK